MKNTFYLKKMHDVIRKATALGVAVCFLTSTVLAEPPQITVVDGQGNFAMNQDPGTGTTNFSVSGNVVGQTTQANILPGQTWNVNFSNPGDTFLLRVLDPGGTYIWGTLNVFDGLFTLLNTSGIMFGPSAQINVHNAAFLASTLDIQNRDFIEGNYAFRGSADGANRAIINQGLIQTTGKSSVVLMAPALNNAGAIAAPLSVVALAAGDAVTLALDRNRLISIDVTEPVKNNVLDQGGQPVTTQITNTGTIDADGGMVLIDAKALDDIFDRSVNLTGRIRANKAVEGEDGTIRIVAADEILNSGTLEARDGEVHLTSEGLIRTTGYLFAKKLFEQGFTFDMGGVIEVGFALIKNRDDAATIAAGAVLSGTYSDVGNIIVNGNFSLGDHLTLFADSDLNGSGYIDWAAAYTVTGNGKNLTLRASQASTIGSITGVNILTFQEAKSGASPIFSSDPTETSWTDITDFRITSGRLNRFTGGGTVGNPYMIHDVYGLQGMRGFLTSTFNLVNDIDASGTASWNAVQGFVPVGTFQGVFDGQEHTLSGLTINRSSNDAGLFGYTLGATIQNVDLVDVSIAGGAGDNIGALAGRIASTTISNVSVTGAISGDLIVGGLVGLLSSGTIHNSFSTASVTGSALVGGLVGVQSSYGLVNSFYDWESVLINGANYITPGALYSSLYEDWMDGGRAALDGDTYFSDDGTHYLISDLQGLKDFLAFSNLSTDKFRLTADLDLTSMPGFYIPSLRVAEFDGAGHTISNLSVSQSFNNNIGLFGWVRDSAIKDVAIAGSVTGRERTGGLAGYLVTSGATDVSAAVAVSGINYVGGLIGEQASSSTVTASVAAATVSGSSNVGGLVGLLSSGTITDSYFTGSVSGTYLVGGLAGVQSSYGLVNSFYDWENVLINGANYITPGALYSSLYDDWIDGGRAALDVDTYFSDDGTHYLISDLQGLKDFLAFSNLSTDKFRLTADLDLTSMPEFYIPSLRVAEFDGAGHTISNLSVSQSFNNNIGLFGWVRDSEIRNLGAVSGSVVGRDSAGGFVGYQSGATLEEVFSSVTVSGVYYVGGLVGQQRASVIKDSYATGAVVGTGHSVGGLVGYHHTGSSIDNTYASGNVQGGYWVGGLIGINASAVTDSFSVGVVTGTSSVGGLLGRYDSGTRTNNYWLKTATHNSSLNDIGDDGDVGDTNIAIEDVLEDFFSPGHPVYQVGQLTGWDFILPGWDSFNDKLPHLSWEESAGVLNPRWLGGTDSDWFEPSNWSTGSVPGATASAIVLSGGHDPVIGADVNLTGLLLVSGSLIQNASLVISTLFLQTDGSLVQNAPLDVTGTFTLSGGSFSQNAALNVAGAFALSGGSFSQNAALAVTGAFTQSGGAFVSDPSMTFSAADFLLTGGTFDRYTGDGSPGDPYMIFDVYGLQGMIRNLDKNFELANDIDAAQTASWNSGEGFVPVGRSQVALRFLGSFDGNDHAVSGLTINRSSSYAGLFGYTSGATLQNVALSGGSLAIGTGFSGGALVGQALNTVISNVSSTMSVTGTGSNYGLGGLAGTILGGSVVNSSANGAVTAGANSSDVGGLVGTISSSGITDSCASGNVQGGTGSVGLGGLAGGVEGSVISRSYASGSVTGSGGSSYLGGLTGYQYQDSEITDSYATGNVTGSTNSMYLGGLVGWQYDAEVTSSYATGSVTGGAGSQDLGGLVGYQEEGGIINSFSTGVVSGTANVGGLLGNNFSGSMSNVWWHNGVNSSGVGTGDSAGVFKATGNSSDFYSPNHSVYDIGGAGQWDIFSPVWDVYSASGNPRLHWENHGSPDHVWSGAASAAWDAAGNWSVGSVPIGTSIVHVFDRVNDPVTSGDMLVASLSLYTGLLTLGNNLTVAQDLYVLNGTLDADGYAVSEGGDWTAIQFTNMTNHGNVILTGSGTIAGGTFGQGLLVSGSYTLGGDLVVTGELTTTGTLDAATHDVSEGGDWSADQYAQITNYNDVTLSGSGTIATGIFVNSLSVSGTYTLLGDLVVTDDLLTAGTLAAATHDISEGGNWSSEQFANISNYGDVTLTGAGKNIAAGTFAGGLSVTGSYTLDGDLVVTDDLVTAGTLAAATYDISEGGNWSSEQFANISNYGDVTLTGAGKNIAAGTFSGGLSVTGSYTLGGDLVVVGDLTTSGSLDADGYDVSEGGGWSADQYTQITNYDDVTLSGSGVIASGAFANGLLVSGSYTLGGSLTVTGDLITSGSVDAAGHDVSEGGSWSAAQFLNISNLGDVTLTGTGKTIAEGTFAHGLLVSGGYTLGGNLVVVGELTTSGSLDADGYDVSEGGSWSADQHTKITNYHDVALTGSGTIAPGTFGYDLAVSGSYTLGGSLTVTGDLITSGSVDAAGQDVSEGGNWSAAQFLNISNLGDVTLTGTGKMIATGTFGSGLLVSGSYTLSGNLIVAGDLITDGTLAAATYDVSEGGDWTAGQFANISNYGDVTLTGTGKSLAGGAFAGGLSVTGSYTLGGDLVVGGNWSSSGTIAFAGHSVTLGGTDKELSPGNNTFSSLLISGTYLLNGPLIVSGDLSVTGGLDADLEAITEGGDWSFNNITNLGDVTLTGAGNTIAAGTFGNLTVTGSYTQLGSLIIAGNYAQTAGSFTGDPSLGFSVGGSFSIPSTAGAFNRYGVPVGGFYLVRDIYDLQAMQGYLASSFKLNNDIDASSTALWNSGEGFVPIGSVGDGFTGVLDGNAQLIQGLVINRPSQDVQGLFGAANNAVIEKVGLESMSLTGRSELGALVGRMIGGAVRESFASGSVISFPGGNMIGGLVGYGQGVTIENSYARVSVAATGGAGTDMGGLIGRLDAGTLQKTYASGSVSSANGGDSLGGLIGRQQGTALVENNFSTGMVSASSGSVSNAGGLVGSADGAGTWDNNYWNKSGGNVVLEDVGNTGDVDDVEIAHESAQDVFYDPLHPVYDIEGVGGWDFLTPVWDSYQNELPRLRWEEHAGYQGRLYIWSGNQDRSWDNANNWLSLAVPDANTNAYIIDPDSNDRFPIAYNGVTVRSITIKSGALEFRDERIDIGGDLLLYSGGTLIAGRNINIAGNWINNGGIFDPGTGTVTFSSITADQTIGGTEANQAFNDIAIAKGSKVLNVSGSTTTLSMRNLTFNSGKFQPGTASTVNISGNVTINAFGDSQFYGLTLDADTFTLDDVENLIGDTVRSYFATSMTDDTVLDAILNALNPDGTRKIKTLIISIPYNSYAYSDTLARFWGANVPVAAQCVTMVNGSRVSTGWDPNNGFLTYIQHVKDRIAATGSGAQFIVEFGNEYDYSWNWPTWFPGEGMATWYAALTAATDAVHAAFGDSVLVSTAVRGDYDWYFEDTINTGVDMIGINNYRGLGNTDTLIADWNAACTQAGRTPRMYLSETGFPSWNTAPMLPGDGDETVQSANTVLLWNELLKQNLGMTFMSFEDNKRKGGAAGIQDDREDYWGWLHQDGTLKPVYITMAGAWANEFSFLTSEFDAGSAVINVSGDWINNGGSFLAGTSQVDLTGAGVIREQGSFAGLSISGARALDTEGLLTETLAFGAGGSLDANNLSITTGGDWDNLISSAKITDLGTVILTGAGTVSEAGAFEGLVLEGARELSVSGLTAASLVFDGGTLDANGFSITTGGDWNNFLSGGKITESGLVTLTGAGTLSESAMFENGLVLVGSRELVAHDLVTSSLDFVGSGSLDANELSITTGGDWNNFISAGRITESGLVALTGAGTINESGTFENGLTLTGARELDVSGLTVSSLNFSGAGSLDAQGLSITTSDDWHFDNITNWGEVRLAGSDKIIYSDSQVFDSLTILGTYVLADGLTTTGDLHILSGALDAAGQAMDIAGSWINNETFISGGNTVTLSGAGGTITSGASHFSDLTITGNYDLNDALNVTGDLDIQGGALNARGKTISLQGDWRNTGTFVHGNNTVSLSGTDQAVSGNNTFYNLSKVDQQGSTLTFEAGALQTVEGLLTLQGIRGNRLRLRSDDPSSGALSPLQQWQFWAASTDLGQLDIKDTHNTGEEIVFPWFDSLDRGNNTGFIFPVEPNFWWDLVDLSRLAPDEATDLENLLPRLLPDPGEIQSEGEIVDHRHDPAPVIAVGTGGALQKDSSVRDPAVLEGCRGGVDRAMSETCRGVLTTTVEVLFGQIDLLGEEPGMVQPFPAGKIFELREEGLKPLEPALPVMLQRLSRARTEYVVD